MFQPVQITSSFEGPQTTEYDKEPIMSHCAYCKTTESGYPGNHWENLQEGVKLCKNCIETVAKKLILKGRGHHANLELKKILEDPTNPPKGIYRHYKGNVYEVIGMALHSETLETLVVYQALYKGGHLWVRPLKMFIEEVTCDGKLQPRFRFIEPKTALM